jgi:hypothetical protein
MRVRLAIAATLATMVPAFASAASEGGDTWSELQPAPSVAADRVASERPLVVATTASLSDLRSERPNLSLGRPAEDASADRVVSLGPDSHWVNVAYGESVQFVVQADSGQQRTFAWKFDVSPDVTMVDLSQVAPAQFVDHDVQVFVSPNPLYSGD